MGQIRLNTNLPLLSKKRFDMKVFTHERTKQSIEETRSPAPKLQVQQSKIKRLIFIICQEEQSGNNTKCTDKEE